MAFVCFKFNSIQMNSINLYYPREKFSCGVRNNYQVTKVYTVLQIFLKDSAKCVLKKSVEQSNILIT